MHTRPALPCPGAACSAGRGAGDRGCIHVPAAPSGSARRPPPPTHAWRPWGSPAAGCIRLCSARPQPRLSSGTCCRLCRRLAPGSGLGSRSPSPPQRSSPGPTPPDAPIRPGTALTPPPRPARGPAPGVWVRLSSSLSSCARPPIRRSFCPPDFREPRRSPESSLKLGEGDSPPPPP